MQISLRGMFLAALMTGPAWLSAAASEGIAIHFINGQAYDAAAAQVSYNNTEMLLNGGCAAPAGCAAAAAPAAPGCAAAAAPTCGADPACGADPSCTAACDADCDDCDDFCDFGPFLACKRWNIIAGAPIMVRNNVPEGIITSGGLVPSGDGPEKEVGPGSGLYAGFQGSAIKYRDNFRDLEFGILAMGNGGPFRFDPVGPGSTLEPFIPAGPGIAISQYKSDIFSIEGNVRFRRSDRFSWIAGVRYINLNETMVATVAPAAGEVAIGAVQVSNNLFGSQLGASAILAQGGRWTVNGVARAGIYYNDASNVVAGVLGTTPFLSQQDANPIAFEADTQLMATYWITDHLGLRFGYQVMVFDNVAVVPTQPSSLLGNGIDTNSTPFWHGALVQAEVTW
ncbi:MAG: hypothetical protein SFU86_03365 [Pirellulaceae bacterium]|nr:hypothetical protein [Pirellulaceae bacterium]